MSYVIEPEAQVAIPVAGSDDLFPVRRIYCVGRNYAAHAREMGFDPDREPPFFFCKPDNTIVVGAVGETVDVPYPPQTTELSPRDRTGRGDRQGRPRHSGRRGRSSMSGAMPWAST